jgi:hypothetical protein
VVRARGAEAYRFRGKTVARSGANGINFVWQRVSLRDGAHTFRVNRRHPVLRSLIEDAAVERAVERALRLVEENLPIEAIVMEVREHPDTDRGRPFERASQELMTMLREAQEAVMATGLTAKEALEMLSAAEPFSAHPELIQVLLEEVSA